MKTSNYWIGHFKLNAQQKRINWELTPKLTDEETYIILSSLQAWQLGETSEGMHLIKAATKHAKKISDPDYVNGVKLFIKEEQKHGHNLGCYLDSIGQKRIKKSWDDSIFRYVRHFATNMELWTLAVLAVESTAQVFYQSLKDCTNCPLLKEICTDILIDEAYHINFQTERLAIITENKSIFSKNWRKVVYKYFFFCTACLVWVGHRRLFKAGGNAFDTYIRKMEYKYNKTLKKITDTSLIYNLNEIGF